MSKNTNPASTLWCIHIPGPDDIHAASSKGVAEQAAFIHNACMRAYFDKSPPSEFSPSSESLMAVVIKYPGSEKSHARALKAWNASDWGIGRCW